MTWESTNVFLNGPYAPWQEEGDAFDLECEGSIPRELNGTLYRIASSPHYRLKYPDRYHWFDGDGMVHSFQLSNGRASYRNRYVMTAGLEAERAANRSLYDSLMNGGAPMGAPPLGFLTGEAGAQARGMPTAPTPSPTESPFKNPGNTNVTVFDGRLLVFSEAGLPHELDPITMETRGLYDFHGGVQGPVTAHWKLDPDNGDLLFYGASGSAITWYQADRQGRVIDRHSFDIGLPCLMHDFLVTPDYALFLVSPTVGHVENVFMGKPLLVWDPEALGGSSMFAILDRQTHALRYIDAGDVFGVTHYSNAFQRGNTIVVDGHRVDRFGIRKDDLEGYPGTRTYNEWFTSMYATPWRWEIDLASGKVSGYATSEVQGEFPRINDRLAGQDARFGYYATTRKRTGWFTDGLAKLDYLTGRTQVQDLGGVLVAPSEPTFVPRAKPRTEDDGWLIAYWWDPAKDKSELVILDALEFERPQLARVKLHHRVPLGFHGNWVPRTTG